jgi:hypothetical protein
MIISHKDGVNYIVDGQQRLTTLTLLLIYLNHLQKTQSEDHRVKIDDLIYSAKYGRKSFNISVDEREECMEALFEGSGFDVEGKSEAVANIAARYEDIDQAFPSELREAALPYFIDWLIENVHLAKIIAYSDEDAYEIFETMNDRGLSLSPIDMLKGFLLSNIADSQNRTACNDLWRKRVQQLTGLGKDVDSDCFKSWLRSRHAQTIRERMKDAEPGDFDRIGSEFHRWVRDMKDQLGLDGSDSYVQFIKGNFDFYCRQYVRIIEASRKLQPSLEHVFYNAQAGFTLQPIVLLAPVEPKDDDATINLKWRLSAMYLDTMLTRRAWNYRSTDQSTMKYPTFKIVLAIRGLDPNDLAATLKEDLDNEEEVIATKETYALHGMNRKQIVRILARMIDYMETGSGIASHYLEYTGGSGSKRYEVEHIWANKPDRHKDEYPHPADFDAYRNRIGGLLLLPKSFNASYGDLPYAEKLAHYNSQNLLARSLHPQCYEHNPGFRKFLRDTGLLFEAQKQFKKANLDSRQLLYRQLAERIWDPENLLREV